MKLREGIGFKFLSIREQQLYKVMLRAFSSMALEFKCPLASRGVDIMKVMETLLGDNPDVIYFDKTKIKFEETLMEKTIFLTGLYSSNQAAKIKTKIEDVYNNIVSIVKSESKDDYSLLFNLYKILQKNIVYDVEELNAISGGFTKNPFSHNAYGALVNKKAVCDGFSSAFALVAQKLGFDCTVISGQSGYSSAGYIEHAWNIIKLRDKYYHLDCTWDTRSYEQSSEFFFDYFLLCDKDMGSDHIWNRRKNPQCTDSSLSFHNVFGFFAINTDQLKNIIRTYSNYNTNFFRIKLSSNFRLPKDPGNFLMEMVFNEIVKPGMSKQASYIWNENIRCFSVKIK